jgi:hypothetical protein
MALELRATYVDAAKTDSGLPFVRLAQICKGQLPNFVIFSRLLLLSNTYTSVVNPQTELRLKSRLDIPCELLRRTVANSCDVDLGNLPTVSKYGNCRNVPKPTEDIFGTNCDSRFL